MMDRVKIIKMKSLKSRFIITLIVKICFLLGLCTLLSIIFVDKLIFDGESVLWTFSTIALSSVTLFGILAAFTIFRLQSDRQEIELRQNQLEALIEETEEKKQHKNSINTNPLDFLLEKRSSNSSRVKRAIEYYFSTGNSNLAYECAFHFLEIQRRKSRIRKIRLEFFPSIIQLITLVFISIVLTPFVYATPNNVFLRFFENANFYKITIICIFFVISFAFLTLLNITRALVNFAMLDEEEAFDMSIDTIDGIT